MDHTLFRGCTAHIFSFSIMYLDVFKVLRLIVGGSPSILLATRMQGMSGRYCRSSEYQCWRFLYVTLRVTSNTCSAERGSFLACVYIYICLYLYNRCIHFFIDTSYKRDYFPNISSVSVRLLFSNYKTSYLPPTSRLLSSIYIHTRDSSLVCRRVPGGSKSCAYY